jgi:predicted ATPase/signal transduction histidine kinase
MASIHIDILGYHISEELYNGSRTIVYRGIREADSLPVVMKLLKNPYPNFSELVQFRNQYTIAKNLNFPGIIQTYSLESFQNGYILVMEDFGGISLSDYFAKNNHVSFLEVLQIAISLCETLDILYHQRIIHKDIKPSNILINPETKQVKLIDFSIAFLLPRETQFLKNPNVLKGTLFYLSPEQTGRMNRSIDYRTDFYSLGVTFYELLTGQLPFISDKPIELVYSHIAKIATFASEIKSEIPQVIAEIISKLMAKNSEERYQSSLGLKHDLETCLYQIKETGKITDFEIAQKDICDRFIIPDKLYGRESEVEQLLAAFDRVAATDSHYSGDSRSQDVPGNAYLEAEPLVSQEALPRATPYQAVPGNEGKGELMLVAGFSGIGKTAVVNEVHKPIVKQRGYFIKGKFDQFNRNIPFSAFVQAFRDLMEQLLAESDAQIQQWKSKILEAVGENGQVIIEVIPELEKIIGQQPPSIELSGTAAENRLNLLFQNFLEVFTTQEHPLVIFLDDLQWADFASLNLIELLIGKSKTSYLFTIGAYRDNEVFPTHPLILMLNEIEKMGTKINKIILQPLSQNRFNNLIADTLKCSTQSARHLADLIYQKTQGNPFFSTQFIKALYQDGLITFNNQGGWECDVTQVRELALTDNVVEFMSTQLEKLPEATQGILKLAACIGSQFDLSTLATVSEKSEIETATHLWTALQVGLILPQTDIYKFYQVEENKQLGELGQENQTHKQLAEYKFLHGRVQQAAYFLIPEHDKSQTHLKIGRTILAKMLPENRGEGLFLLVNQLNLGRSLLEQSSEQVSLAQLNLEAGQKAIASTAYKAAVDYCRIGMELLPFNCWEQQENLTRQLYQSAAQTPMNFQHKYDLVAAEYQQVLDEKKEAIELYDGAIAGARKNGYIQEEALANELAAKFYLNWGKEKVAQEYMQDAYYCYAKWGAKAKTDNLEKGYPQILKPILQPRRLNLNPLETIATINDSSIYQSTHTSTTGSTSISDALDFTSVIKAAQTISSNIEVEELITNLTKIILENSGALKTVLILPQENTWQVRAVTFMSNDNKAQNKIQNILTSELIENNEYIPIKIINYVKNTQKTIVIDNCQTDIPGIISKYMLQHKPKSVLCTPILNQGHLVGILYLENQLTSGVFTSDRLQIINFLCTQTAISLENARLYTQAQEKLQQLQEKNNLLAFQSTVSHIAARNGQLSEMLQQFCQVIVDHLGVAFARIWVLNSDKNILELKASAGIYSHLNGSHQFIPVGKFKIGLIAQEKEPHLTNDVLNDPRIGDRQWAKQHGMVAFAGYPLMLGDEILGVVAMFSQKTLSVSTLASLQVVATEISLGIQRKLLEASLEEKAITLEKALEDLQNAQLQIVQSEKMSALGNLVAGVAHEMNNPLGFISATLQQAKPTFYDIVEHLKLYQENLSNPGDKICDHAEEIDLDYTLEDLPKMIDGMVMACDRLENISTSLRTFSRADKDYKVPFNIHEGIDSTILILKHRLKANEQHPPIEVITEYDKLPMIECFSGQLNQVFMNILANAIDSLEEANKGRTFAEIEGNPNQITITTSIENNHVKIKISDNGKGMSEQVKQKIFDHLFTTKDVGKGTGLGLAIARQIIVEKHGGIIKVDSTLGQGTEFIISIPITA